MILGLFSGVFTLAYVGGKMFITPIELSKIVAFFCLVGLLIPLKFYRKWFKIERIEGFLLSVFGIGPLAFSSLLWLNFLWVENRSTEQYAIVDAEITTDFIATITFQLQDDALMEYPEFRRFEITNKELLNGTTVSYQFAEGILGYRVVKDRQVNS